MTATKTTNIGTSLTETIRFGGRRKVGLGIKNHGPGTFNAFILQGTLFGGDLQSWEDHLLHHGDFAKAGAVLVALQTTTNPTVLAPGETWSATIDASAFWEIRILASATATSTATVILEA